MLYNKQFMALVAALFVQESFALNIHRHGHRQVHEKKAIVYKEEIVTTTDWTTVTVYADGSPFSTPKRVYKASHHTTSKSSTTSSSTSSSTSTTPTPTPSSTSSSTSSSSSVVTPTTLATSAPPAQVSAAPKVQAAANPPVVHSYPPPVPTVSTTSAKSATTSQASSSGSYSGSSGSPSGAKRGIAYNDGTLISPFIGSGTKCSWSYNWDQVPSASAPENVEYVPMLWSPSHGDKWISHADAAIKNGATSLLGFNECDNAGQCNMDAGDAATAHQFYMKTYAGRVRIGTPAITSSVSNGQGVSWLTAFLDACGSDCYYDFCAAHWYGGADADGFLSHLVDVHKACNNKPIWVTEFQPSGSPDDIDSFLTTVMAAMDSDPKYSFVERYAYFMADTSSLLSSPTTLSLYGKTYAYS